MIEAIDKLSAGVRGSSSTAASTTSRFAVSGPEVGDPVQGTFQSVLADLANAVADNLKTAEAASIGGLNNVVPAQRVVESIMAAEQSLHTAIAVRDKVVAAYLELSRMSI